MTFRSKVLACTRKQWQMDGWTPQLYRPPTLGLGPYKFISPRIVWVSFSIQLLPRVSSSIFGPVFFFFFWAGRIFKTAWLLQFSIIKITEDKCYDIIEKLSMRSFIWAFKTLKHSYSLPFKSSVRVQVQEQVKRKVDSVCRSHDILPSLGRVSKKAKCFLCLSEKLRSIFGDHTLTNINCCLKLRVWNIDQRSTISIRKCLIFSPKPTNSIPKKNIIFVSTGVVKSCKSCIKITY